MANKNKIRFTDGTVFVLKKGGRESINSLDEALELKAKCCGISCCDNTITLDDQTTGDKYVIYVNNGVLTTQLKSDFKENGPL